MPCELAAFIEALAKLAEVRAETLTELEAEDIGELARACKEQGDMLAEVSAALKGYIERFYEATEKEQRALLVGAGRAPNAEAEALVAAAIALEGYAEHVIEAAKVEAAELAEAAEKLMDLMDCAEYLAKAYQARLPRPKQATDRLQ